MKKAYTTDEVAEILRVTFPEYVLVANELNIDESGNIEPLVFISKQGSLASIVGLGNIARADVHGVLNDRLGPFEEDDDETGEDW
jgi:hypothetical protein